MKPETAAMALAVALTITGAMVAQHTYDLKAIEQARQNEMQSNRLEDQCKAQDQTVFYGSSLLDGSSPKLTHLPHGGWTYEHIPMPQCPDKGLRSVEIPERDEVDALTVRCEMPK